MHAEAEQLLEYVIERLDAIAGPNRQGECDECRKLREASPPDEDAIAEHFVVHSLSAELAMGTLDGTQEVLIGTNILTPCLVSRGWRLWRRPLLSPAETEAVKRANLQCSERMTTSLSELKAVIRDSSDTLDAMRLQGEVDRVVTNGMLGLSDELKKVLGSRQ